MGAVGLQRPLPYPDWMTENVPPDAQALRTTDQQVLHTAVCDGLGLGLLAEHDACVRPDLVTIIPPDEAWSTTLWMVTHVDLHRTTKVQAFLTHLMSAKLSFDCHTDAQYSEQQ